MDSGLRRGLNETFIYEEATPSSTRWPVCCFPLANDRIWHQEKPSTHDILAVACTVACRQRPPSVTASLAVASSVDGSRRGQCLCCLFHVVWWPKFGYLRCTLVIV